MSEQSKIIRIIRKLLALGDKARNNNQNEAESALALANKLLLEHNLSMAVVGDYSESKVTQDKVRYKSKFVWKMGLANLVARHNLCTILCDVRRGNGWIIFVGRKDNIEASKIMYDYFLAQVEFLLAGAVKEIDDLNEGYPFGKLTFISSFCYGVVQRLSVRLDEVKRRVEESNANGCKALMVVVSKENEDFIREHFGKLRHRTKRTMSTDPVARALGFKEGRKIRIHKEVVSK